MKKTVFKVPGMDCPSEEQLISLALSGAPGFRGIEFDLSNRQVTVHHDGDAEQYARLLEPLKLGSTMLSTERLASGDALPVSDAQQSRTLKLLLGINAAMFVVEFAVGWLAQSTGLIADSLDMFADAAVYGLSLYAVGKAAHFKNRAARLSGYFQLALALGVLIEVLRRFVAGSEPEPPYMIGVASLALVANASCLLLLFRHREGEVHMKASWIFSTNDVIANLGVIAAGAFVHYFRSNIPDLVIGLVIAAVVLRGAVVIVRMSRLQA